MTSLLTEKGEKKKHEHIWKYRGEYDRVCEAPIPTIESCGKIEMLPTPKPKVEGKEV